MAVTKLMKSAQTSVELFSGCGGLAMGLSLAGFKHALLVERDTHACATLDHNRRSGHAVAQGWPLNRSDVRAIDWSVHAHALDLVAGGPPCQPFSVGGLAEGQLDERDMWGEAIRAVREISPKAFLFENVRGLLRPKFSSYVDWIAAYLAAPAIERRAAESHSRHAARLQKGMETSEYFVQVVPVNAADYGAPQRRNRVLFIGFRKDLSRAVPGFPRATHSRERLLWDKWVTGEYWTRHGLRKPSDKKIPTADLRKVSQLRDGLLPPEGLPWVTCRDAFVGLDDPATGSAISNHVIQPGARSYPGHTGSPIDEPAKALKAGVHGVPGGENMLLAEDGTVRYFTVREAARLQGLPDDFEFPGSWSESMRQIGNAVPVHLSRFAGSWISTVLKESRNRTG